MPLVILHCRKWPMTCQRLLCSAMHFAVCHSCFGEACVSQAENGFCPIDMFSTCTGATLMSECIGYDIRPQPGAWRQPHFANNHPADKADIIVQQCAVAARQTAALPVCTTSKPGSCPGRCLCHSHNSALHGSGPLVS